MTSYSEIKSYQRCPQLWEYRYKEELRLPSTAMRRGTWVHAGIALHNLREAWQAQTLLHDPQWTFEDGDWVTQDPVSNGLDPNTANTVTLTTGFGLHNYWFFVRDMRDTAYEEEQEEVFKAYDQARRAVTNYLAWEQGQSRRKILAVEQRVESDGWVGVIDEVYEDAAGHIVVRDYKTTKGSVPKDEMLLMDGQPYLYAALAEEALNLPSKVGAIEWVYLLISDAKPPRRTKDGSLHGQLPSSPTSVWKETFQEWNFTWPPTPAAAQALNSKAWEKKLGAPLSPKDLLAMPKDEGFVISRRFPVTERAIGATLEEMVKCQKVLEKGPPVYRSTGRQCSSCEFLVLCSQKLAGRKPVVEDLYHRKKKA